MNPVADPSPEQFGPYEVYERLGLGGMATVYRAKKRGPAGFERSVALKRMLQHLAEDPAFVESFVREAKVASLLQHPNIAQVYDFGRISGVYYIAMELVAGFDVRKLLRYANRANEAIPMPVILSILGELCDALDYAHTFVDENGQPLHIVHRDVSPSNMIMAHTGHLKVIDFGIAKANSRQLYTESGQVKGKLGYMSPEVALGMPVGPVSDVFSVGVVAWELVTASPLFSARSDFETMRKIREQPIAPPSRHNPDCPPKLDQLIAAALQREPENRLASARMFRTALDQIAVETGSHVSARAVAEWMLKFVQPDDPWARAAAASLQASSTARNRSPSGSRSLPLPPEPPTAVMRGTHSRPVPLRRSAEDIQLASEIWGEDVATIGDGAAPAPDFHVQVASTPAPAELTPAHVRPPTQRPPTQRPPTQRPPTQPPPPSALRVPSQQRPPSHVHPVQPRSSKKPLLALGALALVAAALAGVLIWKRQSAGPTNAALRFEIEPAGAVLTLAGKRIGDTSPLETQLAAGTYPVIVELDGYEPYKTTLTVREGEHQTIHVALDKADTAIAIEQPPPPPPPPPVQEPPKQVAVEAPAEEEPPKQPTHESKRPATKQTKKGKKEKVVAEAPPKEERKEDPPKEDPPKVDPPKVDPPKEDPPKIDPPKVDPPKPTRALGVAATAVTKLSGDVPTLRAKSAEGGGNVSAKLCIDESGHVSSVKIVKGNLEIASQLEDALSSWRYKPFLRDGKAIPVCFLLSFPVVVKGG
ncbi:MAG TPA: protein kinase [Kofleriaceae bacterium]|nr:protein kinase [Kofleriaceae bacterium]